MAQTYKAEGQQIATGLRALFAIIALSLFLLFPKMHWGVFGGVFVAGLFIGPWVGEKWVEKMRDQKKSGGKQSTTQLGVHELQKVIKHSKLPLSFQEN